MSVIVRGSEECQLLTLTPDGRVKDTHRTLLQCGAHFDLVRRTLVIPIRELRSLMLAAKPRGVTFRPTPSLRRALLAEADNLAHTEFDGPSLYPHQEAGVGFLWMKRAAILADDMGIGKTPQWLRSILPDAPAIVVCPKSCVRAVWERECKIWRRDLSTVVIEHRGDFRYPVPGELVICTYGLLVDEPPGMPWPGTHLCADEAHALGRPSTKQTQRFRKLAHRVRQRNGYVTLATGTPIENLMGELWTHLVTLGIHKETYGSFHAFAKQTGATRDAFGWRWDPAKIPAAGLAPLRSYVLRRERAEVLPNLPTKTYQTYEVPAPPGVDDLATLRVEDLIAAIEGEQDLDVLSSLTMSVRKRLATWKLDQAMPLIEASESERDPWVVFSAHREPIERLGERPGWTAIHGGVASDHKRAAAVADFQANRLRGIAVSIRAGGSGLTLTRSHKVLFIDRDWVATKNRQAEDRVCRIGQDRGVVITDVISTHPIDYRVTEILRSKLMLEARSIDALTSNPQASCQQLAAWMRETAHKIPCTP